MRRTNISSSFAHSPHERDHLGWSDQENLSSALVCGKLHVAPTYSFPFPQTGATVYTFGFVFVIVHIPSQVVLLHCKISGDPLCAVCNQYILRVGFHAVCNYYMVDSVSSGLTGGRRRGESAQMAQFTPPGGGASPPVPYYTLGLVCIKCSVSMQCIKMQCTDSTVVHCSPLLCAFIQST